MVTVLHLQPSVHQLATPFSTGYNLCVPLPLHTAQVVCIIGLLYCIVLLYCNDGWGLNEMDNFVHVFLKCEGRNCYIKQLFFSHGMYPTTIVRDVRIHSYNWTKERRYF